MAKPKTEYGIVFPTDPDPFTVSAGTDRAVLRSGNAHVRVPALAEAEIFKILGRTGIVAERLSDRRKPRRYLHRDKVVAEILTYVTSKAKNEAED